jgi:hypothetical protein
MTQDSYFILISCQFLTKKEEHRGSTILVSACSIVLSAKFVIEDKVLKTTEFLAANTEVPGSIPGKIFCEAVVLERGSIILVKKMSSYLKEKIAAPI